MLGPVDGGSVTFNASTYRDDLVVSCSGGPASIHTEAAELVRTEDTTTLTVWRNRDDRREAHNAVYYTVTVPVWDWHPVPATVKPEIAERLTTRNQEA